MEIERRNRDEDPAETMKYIDSKRNWNVEKQTYRIPLEKENEIAHTTNLSECEIYWRGKYLIVEHNDLVHFWDSLPYCFLKQAVEIIELEKPAKWKTIDNLTSLRMAIRQTEVNHCGYVDSILNGKNMTLALYREFMRLARDQDLKHHGRNTF